MRSFLTYWLPPFLWASVILVASGPLFSAGHSGTWLQSILRIFLGDLPAEPAITVLHFVIRKLAHLVEYGILGALLFRALRAGQSGWRLRWALAGFMLALPVAAADEVLQSMVVGRTGSAVDVLLDLCGAGAAQLFFRRRNVPATGLLFSRS